jgi:hypothetical protein
MSPKREETIRNDRIDEWRDRGTISDYLTRRSFLKAAASLGAAGAGICFAAANSVSADEGEVGRVTLDALLLTYVSSPLGSLGFSSAKLTNSYGTTLRLRSIGNSPILLDGKIPVQAEVFTTGTGPNRVKYRQSSSHQVEHGIGADSVLGRLTGSETPTSMARSTDWTRRRGRSYPGSREPEGLLRESAARLPSSA